MCLTQQQLPIHPGVHTGSICAECWISSVLKKGNASVTSHGRWHHLELGCLFVVVLGSKNVVLLTVSTVWGVRPQ